MQWDSRRRNGIRVTRFFQIASEPEGGLCDNIDHRSFERLALARRSSGHPSIVLGPLFLLVVLFARGGINGLLESLRRD